MKRKYFLFLIILICCSFISCKNPNDKNEPNNQIKYVISFLTLGAGEIEKQVYNPNEEVTSLPSPSKLGYLFDGWYYDSYFTKKVTYPFKIEKSIALFAGWVENIEYELDIETNTYYVNSADPFLSTIYIPSTYNGLPVTGIRKSAFENHPYLTKINLPSSIKVIEERAFLGCSKLKTINLPDGLEKIGRNVFEECSNLNYKIVNGIKYIDNWLIDATNLVMSSVTLEDNIVGIFPYAFFENQSIISISIPNRVQCIYEGTFTNTSITSISIGNSVNNINIHAFDDMNELKAIEVSNDNPNYMSNNGVLYNKDGSALLFYPLAKNNTTYHILSTTKEIGERAFAYNSYLEEVIFPSSLISIKSQAFLKCENLEKIIINQGIENIYNEAFANCSKLLEVTIPNSVKTLEKDALKNSINVEKLTIPFLGNDHTLTYYFYQIPTKLKELVILSGETLNYDSLKQLSFLFKLSLPNTIKNIEAGAFRDCSILKDFTINDNPNYMIINNILYNNSKSILLMIIPISNIKELTIDNRVEKISAYAFANSSNLEKVTINSNVKFIGTRAFFKNTNLKNVYLNEGITTIEEDLCFDTPNVHIYCKDKLRGDNWSEGWNTFNYPVTWEYYLPVIIIETKEYHIAINETIILDYQVINGPANYKLILTPLTENLVSINNVSITGITQGELQVRVEVENHPESAIFIIIIIN